MIGIFKLEQFGWPKTKVLCSPCHQMQAQHGKSGNSSSCLGHSEQQGLKVPLTTSCCARAVLPAAKPINCSPVWQRCREGDAWAGRPAVKHMEIPGVQHCHQKPQQPLCTAIHTHLSLPELCSSNLLKLFCVWK